jgi:hypothetical protein
MDKNPQKRGKEAYTRSPTLIYMTSCKEKRRGRNEERGERDCQKKVYCQGKLPFSIDVKGGEKEQKKSEA